jgi:hypothetical protein
MVDSIQVHSAQSEESKSERQSKPNIVYCIDLVHCVHCVHCVHWLHLEPTHRAVSVVPKPADNTQREHEY